MTSLLSIHFYLVWGMEKITDRKEREVDFLRLMSSSVWSKGRGNVIPLCCSSVTSAQQPMRTQETVLTFPTLRRSMQIAWLGPTVSYQCRPRRDAQFRLLQIKEILGRMFGKIIVLIFHLDTFASKITTNTVSYFISSLRQPGTLDID